jgi:hypothetical protein
MRMSAVASFFDREQAYDGYTGEPAFKCQYSSFDDSAGDGSTNRRRGMSTAPSVEAPTRRVITLGDQRWIMGEATDDGFLGEAQRKNYNLKKATHLVAVLSPLQACQAAAGTPTWVQLHYFKDTSNALSDAEYDTFWNVFVAPNEPVGKGTFLRSGAGTLYRVRGAYPVAEGFTVAQTDELEPDARRSATFNVGAYDPISDSFAAGSSTVDVIFIEPSKYYRFRSPAESPVRAGDMTVVVPSTVAAAPGVEFTSGGLRWRLHLVEAISGAFMCLARRV